jgi:hypothetical protein
MSGRHSRNKGSRAELALTRYLQDAGFAATKRSGLYVRGHDVDVPLLGRDMRAEVKVRGGRGFSQLYKWLDGADLLFVRSDRQRPLVILRLDLATEIAIAAEKGRVRTGTDGGDR